MDDLSPRDWLAFKVASDVLQYDAQKANWYNDPAAWATERLGEFVWSKQGDVMRAVADHPLVAVRSCHGIGKAAVLCTMLPTPDGWTTMGELQPGDHLLDEHGKPVEVTAVSDVQLRDTYRLTFDDRSEVIASDNHEWQVVDIRHRPRKIADWRDHWAATVTMTTSELAADLKVNGQWRWRIPTCRPLEGQRIDLPIGPYTLGVWLGDGATHYAQITLNREDAPELLAAFTAEGTRYRIRPGGDRPGSQSCGLLGVLPAMRELGLLGHKHIPARIMRADVATRLAVLQGLMDADGFLSSGQSVGLDLCNERLAADAAELVRTFGWKAFTSTKPATLYGRVVGTVYRLQFRPDLPVFRLARYQRDLAPGQESRHTQRTIVAIEQIEQRPTKCAMVDSPTHLYLIGESLIPTHNSHLASRLVGWFLDTRPVGKTFVVTTAPTASQVRTILWRYISQMWAAHGLDGVVNQAAEWKIGSELVAFGRKPSDYNESAFQGIHAKHLLVILDEACGVPEQLWIAADALATSVDSHIVAIGNPDTTSSHFYGVCTTEPGWHRMKISAFDSPNFTGEEVPAEVSETLVQQSWVEDKRLRWGESNPLYAAKVLGEFSDDEAGLIPLGWVVAANNRWLEWREKTDHRYEQPAGRMILGVDVGHMGEDETVIATRQGWVIEELEGWRGADTMQVATLVETRLARRPQSVSIVDSIGVGAGVLDRLRQRKQAVRPFVAGAATTRREQTGTQGFVNVRSAAWWNLRELLDPSQPGGSSVCLPPDDDLTADLTTPRWESMTGAKIRVESKDMIRKRLRRSTDRGDAVVQAFWVDPGAAYKPEPGSTPVKLTPRAYRATKQLSRPRR